MDTFINIAKQGYEVYSGSQPNDNVSKTGGHEYNSPHNASHSSHNGPSIDHDVAVSTALKHGSGESSLFSTALGFLSDNKKEHERPVDEVSVTKAHTTAYGSGNTNDLSAHALGSAAALQVLQQFMGGSDSGSSHSSGGHGSGYEEGGGSQTQLISLAMAEASKLFDKSGGTTSGNKQDAVNGAAMTIMKLLVQSKFGGAPTTGEANSGGLGQLLSLASKFSK